MTSVLQAVVEALVDNHLSSFVHGFHAVSKAFVGKRYDVSFALVRFPATWSTRTSKRSKVAAIRVYNDGTDLTESAFRQEYNRLEKIRDPELLNISDVCQVCLAPSQVIYDPGNADDEHGYVCSNSRLEIYLVYKSTFPDAKYLPLTEAMVEYIYQKTEPGTVAICEACGYDDLICEARCGDLDPDCHGWEMYTACGASGELKQCNGTYMRARSEFYENKFVNIVGQASIAPDFVGDLDWKLELGDGVVVFYTERNCPREEFVPEGKWLGYMDATQQCTVSRIMPPEEPRCANTWSTDDSSEGASCDL